MIYSELLILTRHFCIIFNFINFFFREALKKVISIHPNFALNLFTYLKKKISTQLRSRGELSVKFNWSFLIFMVKNAINICKLSDHLLSIGVFLTNSQKNLNKACSKNNIIRLHSLKKNNTEKKRNNKNMYSGIRELSEFVMTKTKNQTSEPNDIKNNTPQGNMKFQYPKIEKISPREQLESGNMTPQQAMKFRFTMKKVQTNLNVD